MILRRIFAAIALLCALTAPSYAQKTKAQLNSEITTNYPDNSVGAITPAILRTTTSDIVNSIMPTAPVVSGNLACFNGTTGLLQDCGTVPIPSITCPASNWFNSLIAGVLNCSQPNFTDLAGSISGAQIPAGTIINTMISSSAAISLSKLATQITSTVVGNASGSIAAPTALTQAQLGNLLTGQLCAPSRSIFTSGTAQTYTTPTCNGVTATWLEVDVQGGGGGGGGSGSTNNVPTAGSASTFGNGSGTLTAGGASAGSTAEIGGAAGACSVSGTVGTAQAIPGSAGGGTPSTTANSLPGGWGGSSFYGGGGAPNTSGAAGQAGAANSGSGGSGGSSSGTASVISASGGGAGCHYKTIITSPTATYTYTVGASASGGSAGTNGFVGGGGAAGIIDVVAHWQ